MSWIKPLLVFVYGYGACFVTLATIMIAILITKKIMGWIHERSKRKKEPLKV